MLKSRREDITYRQIQLEDLSINYRRKIHFPPLKEITVSIQLAFNIFFCLFVNYQLVHQFMHEGLVIGSCMIRSYDLL